MTVEVFIDVKHFSTCPDLVKYMSLYLIECDPFFLNSSIIWNARA